MSTEENKSVLSVDSEAFKLIYKAGKAEGSAQVAQLKTNVNALTKTIELANARDMQVNGELGRERAKTAQLLEQLEEKASLVLEADNRTLRTESNLMEANKRLSESRRKVDELSRVVRSDTEAITRLEAELSEANTKCVAYRNEALEGNKMYNVLNTSVNNLSRDLRKSKRSTQTALLLLGLVTIALGFATGALLQSERKVAELEEKSTASVVVEDTTNQWARDAFMWKGNDK